MVWGSPDKVCSLTLLPTLVKCSVWYMFDSNREGFSSVNNMHINEPCGWNTEVFLGQDEKASCQAPMNFPV